MYVSHVPFRTFTSPAMSATVKVKVDPLLPLGSDPSAYVLKTSRPKAFRNLKEELSAASTSPPMTTYSQKSTTSKPLVWVWIECKLCPDNKKFPVPREANPQLLPFPCCPLCHAFLDKEVDQLDCDSDAKTVRVLVPSPVFD